MKPAQGRSVLSVALVLGLAASTFACTAEVAEAPGDSQAAELTAPEPEAAPSCAEVPFAAPDLDALMPCGSHAGHCFDANQVPRLGTLLAHECTGGDVCVPDAILQAAGGTLTACASVLGGAGRCVSTLFDEVRVYQGELGGTCAPDEACVPCSDSGGADEAVPFCRAVGVHAARCE